ncbi:thiamine pyrophosphate-binding protein [Streptomyces sp. NPDC057199]|uniref:thiamine pyrophosphate-binding protein n=1 Tax=Streptomyces sp. NPDC057199 TaxID=3346047 RepID=UPI00362F76BF
MSEPRYGSDVIVDLLQQAGIGHVAMNPGASFRGIHDSLVHTPGAPEVVLCLHEAIAVGVAQGYAKAAGQPMGVLLHNVVGLQNASMAIYNAWCDRAPMLLMGGTGPKAKTRRRPWIDWIHTASVQAQIVRDFLVWDDEPHDVGSVGESFVRGLTAATSAPGGPVYLCYDVDLQEDEIPPDLERTELESFAGPTPPAPVLADVRRVAQALRSAERPLFLLGHAGVDEKAFAEVAELAHLCGAAVVDTGVRHAFATGHELNATGVPELIAEADLVVAFDVDDLQGPLRGSTAELFNITVAHLRLRAWAHDYQALVPTSAHITATADTMVAALLEELRGTPPDPERVRRRRNRVAELTGGARAARRSAAATAKEDGVVPLNRMVHEVGQALAGERFVLANGTNGRLEHRLWDLDRPGQYLGWHGGGGLGYGVPATIGASLALGDDTLCVDIQADGDLLFLPSALWTAVQQRTRTLFVVNNNRQYGNTVEHAAQIATQRGRTTERRYEGAGLADPATDIAALAGSMGMWARGPITDPDTLAERLAEAVEVVRSGHPALLDVHTPGF